MMINNMIEIGQIWRIDFTKRHPVFIKCVDDQPDGYVFEFIPPGEIPIFVYKDRLDFFLERATLVEPISGKNS